MRDIPEVLRLLREPLFWALSAVGSVVLGVFGNVITPRVVAWLETRSQYRVHRRRSSLVRFYAEVVALDARESGVTHGLLDSIHGIVLGAFFLLVSLIVFFVSTVLGGYFSVYAQLAVNVLFGVPSVLVSVLCVGEGMKAARLVRTVQRRRRAFETYAVAMQIEPTETNRALFNREWDMKHVGTNTDDALKEFHDNPFLKDAG